jgi:hypothetical protein
VYYNSKLLEMVVRLRRGKRGGRGTVLHVHFHGRPIGRFAHPEIEIFALAGFEEEDVVAVVEFG